MYIRFSSLLSWIMLLRLFFLFVLQKLYLREHKLPLKHSYNVFPREYNLRLELNYQRIDFRKFYEEVRPHATNAEEYIQKYYVPELAKKIYNKYRIDFEYFGYKEELQRGVKKL